MLCNKWNFVLPYYCCQIMYWPAHGYSVMILYNVSSGLCAGLVFTCATPLSGAGYAGTPVFELNQHDPANVEWYLYPRHLPIDV